MGSITRRYDGRLEYVLLTNTFTSESLSAVHQSLPESDRPCQVMPVYLAPIVLLAYKEAGRLGEAQRFFKVKFTGLTQHSQVGPEV
jgi:hypothetical protein